MTLRGNTSQACAACKYQRRKCTPECPLAPYFPPDQPKMFQNVHKLFGVKKIQKILESLHPTQQNEAMSSIIYQANVRDRFPVYGCVEVIHLLKDQIRQCEDELCAVNTTLAMYRQQQQQHISASAVAPPFNNVNSPSQLQLAMAPPANDAPSFYLQNPQPPQNFNSENGIPITQNYSYSSSNSPYDSTYLDAKETLVNSMWIHPPCSNENNNCENNDPLPIQSQLVISQSPAIQPEAFQDYDEMNPYFDTIDDRQSYTDCNSSPESSVKDPTQSMEHIADSELKSAAACFSLTSVN